MFLRALLDQAGEGVGPRHKSAPGLPFKHNLRALAVGSQLDNHLDISLGNRLEQMSHTHITLWEIGARED